MAHILGAGHTIGTASLMLPGGRKLYRPHQKFIAILLLRKPKVPKLKYHPNLCVCAYNVTCHDI